MPHRMIEIDMLAAVIKALNELPRTRLKSDRFKDTYELASALEGLRDHEAPHAVTTLMGEMTPSFHEIVSYNDDGTPVPAPGCTKRKVDLLARADASFDTDEELHAYLQGIKDTVGWHEYHTLTEKEAADLDTVCARFYATQGK